MTASTRAVDMELCDIANREPMTGSQRRVFHAVEVLTEKLGMPPTIIEIASYLGVTGNAVGEQIQRLKRKGYFENISSKHRSCIIKR